MKTLAKNDGGYAAEFERARKEGNEADKNRHSEEVKSLVGRNRDNNLEETVQRYIAESLKRQEREEEMLRNFVESTISSLKAHDIGIRNLELKIEQCTNVVKECLKRDTSSHVEPSPEETKVIASEEIEPKTFLEKVKMMIEKEQLLLEELESLPINAPLVKSIKTKTCNLKHLQGFLEAKDKLEGVNSVKLNERCSAILRNELPPKEKDPGSFTLPCLIGNLNISNALADLGASISIMPYSMFTRLGVGKLKPIKTDIES